MDLVTEASQTITYESDCHEAGRSMVENFQYTSIITKVKVPGYLR